MGTAMGHEVFISYSGQDKETADKVCASIEATGVSCWIAPRDILPGVPYGEAIVDALDSSRVFVLIFSASSNLSSQVMREVERAVSKGVPVLPFRIENAPPSKSMEYFISAPHWMDAYTPPMEPHIEMLTTTVRQWLRRQGDYLPPSAHSEIASSPAPTPAPSAPAPTPVAPPPPQYGPPQSGPQTYSSPPPPQYSPPNTPQSYGPPPPPQYGPPNSPPSYTPPPSYAPPQYGGQRQMGDIDPSTATLPDFLRGKWSIGVLIGVGLAALFLPYIGPFAGIIMGAINLKVAGYEKQAKAMLFLGCGMLILNILWLLGSGG